MKTETDHRNWFFKGLYALLALVVPTLVAFVIYDQIRYPVVDMVLDWQTGVIQEVQPDTFADWNGFQVGDIILSVEGIPFSEWQEIEKHNYQVEIQRGEQTLSMELPVVTILMANPWPLISAVTIALTYWSLSLVLLIRRFQQKEIRLLFLTVQALAITLLFPIAYSDFYMRPWALNLSVACLYLAAPLGLHYYLTFPVYFGTPRQRILVLGLAYGGAVVSIVTWLMQANYSMQLGIIHTVIVFTGAMGVVVYAYFYRAAPDERRRLRIVVLSTLFAGMPAVVFYLVPTFLGYPQRMPVWLVGLFAILAPIGYFYTIVKHSLFDIDRLLNRTLVYAILSVGILLIYLGPFLFIYHFASGDILAQAMVAAGLTLIVGLAFERTRTWVQRFVDRLFYGGWYDYPGVVETISDALSRSIQREQVSEVLTQQVSDLMQLHPGELWIGGPDKALPEKFNQPHVKFVFNLQGQYRGIWTVAPRRDGDDFSDNDRRILGTLAHQAEVVLNNVLLIETLQRQLNEIRKAQHQLLRSREEERARLARDLHDGPIQSLVGLNLQLGLQIAEQSDFQKLAEESGSSLNHALGGIKAEVKDLLKELREVCAALRPPMLDTLGLGAAIRALTEDWTHQYGITVKLDFPPDSDLRALSGEVAVNLYRVVQEALANVIRHAQAKKVTISLDLEPAYLVLRIIDDGRGFVPPSSPNKLALQGHFGLVGMQERVDLIGGRLEIVSAPSKGTEVQVTWFEGENSQKALD